MAKLAEIAKIVAVMKAYFPNYNPLDPGATTLALMAVLGDLPFEILENAVLALCAEPRQFAPSAGEIRSRVMRFLTMIEGVPEDWQAYEEVCNMPANRLAVDHIEELGGAFRVVYKKLDWSHRVVGEVAVLMGWPERFPTERPEADRAQFMNAYNSTLQRLMGEKAELPQVRRFIEGERGHARLLEGE